jgi:xanthine dehydrogenase molybdenum-binding subunit
MQAHGMLHLKILRSRVAHARINRICTARAEALPGVIKVLTFANTPQAPYDRGRVNNKEAACDQETLFSGLVRFVGDRIAGVVAQTAEIAQAACGLIEYDYEELPAAFDPQRVLDGAVSIHGGQDILEAKPLRCGDFAALKAERGFCSTAHLQRVTHVAMEPHAAVAQYRPEQGKLTVWTPCQSVFGIRNTLAGIFSLPLNRIRVIKTTMGGSFGSKQETLLEPLAAAAALAVGGTVKLVFSREEVIAGTMLKHPMDFTLNSKFSADGRCLGLDFKVIADAGAYQTVSVGYLNNLGDKLGKVYNIPHVDYQGRSVCTNTPVSGSYRSWSGSEAAYALENHFNQAAAELEIDPVILRLKNIVAPRGLNRLSGQQLGNVRLEDCLRRGSEAFAWLARRAACAAQPPGRYRRGVGMALGSHTSGFFPKQSDMAAAILKMQDDGSVLAEMALHDHGCGTITALSKIIAEELSLPLELVSLNEADTDRSLYDYGCYGSRTIYVAGRAAQVAAQQLKQKLGETAAIMLKSRASRLDCADGYVFDRHQPVKRVSYGEAASYSLNCLERTMTVLTEHPSTLNPGVGAAHFVEVEVDTYTGLVRVGRYLAVHDIGRALNPEMCRAQLGGAVQQGLGIALGEIIKIDAHSGAIINKGLKNYGMLNAYDMPQVECIFIEDEEYDGPFGAKSFGEVAIVPVTPAVVAAVNNALNTSMSDLPLNPATILAAIRQA